MDIKARADLVRACRIENKQTRERQARGFAVLDAAGRAQGRVDRWNANNRRVTQANNQRNREVYGRIGQRIDARIEGAIDAHRARDNAHLRRMNMRNAARQQEHGYNISPEFQRRSQAIANRAASAGLRQRAGTGVDRHRGAIRDIRDNPNRVTEAQRTAAILRERQARANRPRRRTVRGTVTYHDRRGDSTQRTRTDRPPSRGT